MKKMIAVFVALGFALAVAPAPANAGLFNKIGQKLKGKHHKGADPDAQAQAVGPGAYATAGNGIVPPGPQGAAPTCYQGTCAPTQGAAQVYYQQPVYSQPAAPSKGAPPVGVPSQPVYSTPQYHPVGSPQQPIFQAPPPPVGMPNPPAKNPPGS